VDWPRQGPRPVRTTPVVWPLRPSPVRHQAPCELVPATAAPLSAATAAPRPTAMRPRPTIPPSARRLAGGRTPGVIQWHFRAAAPLPPHISGVGQAPPRPRPALGKPRRIDNCSTPPPRGMGTGSHSTLVPEQSSRRHDAPPVYQYTRGCRDTALSLAAAPGGPAAAAQALEAAAYTPSSRTAARARTSLWEQICANMGVRDPYALDADLVMKVTGILHKANYRTAMAHARQAVIIFKERGGTPRPALLRALQRANRAFA